MKDSKTRPLILISLLLLICSFSILLMLGYEYAQRKNEIVRPASVSASDPFVMSRDSLNSLYNGTLWQIRSVKQSMSQMDSVRNHWTEKNDRINQIKQEVINSLNVASNPDGLKRAHEKIIELQQRVHDLQEKNRLIQIENERMQRLFATNIQSEPFKNNMAASNALEAFPTDSMISSEKLSLTNYWVDSISLSLINAENGSILQGTATLFSSSKDSISGVLNIIAIPIISSDSSDIIHSDKKTESLQSTIMIHSANSNTSQLIFRMNSNVNPNQRFYRMKFVFNGQLIHFAQTALH
jgi:hypothetical protein